MVLHWVFFTWVLGVQGQDLTLHGKLFAHWTASCFKEKKQQRGIIWVTCQFPKTETTGVVIFKERFLCQRRTAISRLSDESEKNRESTGEGQYFYSELAKRSSGKQGNLPQDMSTSSSVSGSFRIPSRSWLNQFILQRHCNINLLLFSAVHNLSHCNNFAPLRWKGSLRSNTNFHFIELGLLR